jgi:hypothetical protein
MCSSRLQCSALNDRTMRALRRVEVGCTTGGESHQGSVLVDMTFGHRLVKLLRLIFHDTCAKTVAR